MQFVKVTAMECDRNGIQRHGTIRKEMLLNSNLIGAIIGEAILKNGSNKLVIA